MVLVLFLCLMPALLGCYSSFGLVVVPVALVALACFAVAGAAARPRGSARLGALLGAGLYLLPGVLLVSYEVLTENFEWAVLGFPLGWPSLPGLLSCLE
jgi:hypothetical protein